MQQSGKMQILCCATVRVDANLLSLLPFPAPHIVVNGNFAG